MANIPVRIDPKSTREREVTVVVYVDGKEHSQITSRVEEWAIPYVALAVAVQVDDPDYQAAADAQREHGGPLPKGY